MAIPTNSNEGTKIIHSNMDINKIISPPILGYIMKLVPDKNDTNGIEIILIKTLGSIIFRTKLPD